MSGPVRVLEVDLQGDIGPSLPHYPEGFFLSPVGVVRKIRRTYGFPGGEPLVVDVPGYGRFTVRAGRGDHVTAMVEPSAAYARFYGFDSSFEVVL